MCRLLLRNRRLPEAGDGDEHAARPAPTVVECLHLPEARKDARGERETERDERGQLNSRSHVTNDLGSYLLYNMQTCGYLHVLYMGG